ncbi:hypothetical protein ACFLY6_00725 [Candidatus Dependentiae bacterium]
MKLKTTFITTLTLATLAIFACSTCHSASNSGKQPPLVYCEMCSSTEYKEEFGKTCCTICGCPKGCPTKKTKLQELFIQDTSDHFAPIYPPCRMCSSDEYKEEFGKTCCAICGCPNDCPTKSAKEKPCHWEKEYIGSFEFMSWLTLSQGRKKIFYKLLVPEKLVNRVPGKLKALQELSFYEAITKCINVMGKNEIVDTVINRITTKDHGCEIFTKNNLQDFLTFFKKTVALGTFRRGEKIITCLSKDPDHSYKTMTSAEDFYGTFRVTMLPTGQLSCRLPRIPGAPAEKQGSREDSTLIEKIKTIDEAVEKRGGFTCKLYTVIKHDGTCFTADFSDLGYEIGMAQSLTDGGIGPQKAFKITQEILGGKIISERFMTSRS